MIGVHMESNTGRSVSPLSMHSNTMVYSESSDEPTCDKNYVPEDEDAPERKIKIYTKSI